MEINFLNSSKKETLDMSKMVEAVILALSEKYDFVEKADGQNGGMRQPASTGTAERRIQSAGFRTNETDGKETAVCTHAPDFPLTPVAGETEKNRGVCGGRPQDFGHKRRSPYKSNGVLKARAADPFTNVDFQRMCSYFLNSSQKYKHRNHLLVVLATLTGERIGDVLDLRLYDVLNEDGSVKSRLELYEEKTGKFNSMKLTDHVKEAVTHYIDTLASYRMDDYLFRSNKGKNGHIGVVQAWRIFTGAADALGIPYHVSTHSARKTYANTAIKTGEEGDAFLPFTLQQKLNHADFRDTLKYAGITREAVDKMSDNINEYLFDKSEPIRTASVTVLAPCGMGQAPARLAK